MSNNASLGQSSYFTKVINLNNKNLKTVLLLMVTVCSLAVLYYLYSSQKPAAETFSVYSGELHQYVRVSGQVKASKDANLSFQTLGTVATLSAKVGETVAQGKVLATLVDSDARASLLQANAQLGSQEAVLGQLEAGVRKEEIAIKEQVVSNANNSLAQAYAALPDTIRNVDSGVEDIVKNKLNTLFIHSSERYYLSFSSCDQNLQSVVETNRNKIENLLAEYQTKSTSISEATATTSLDAVFNQAYLVTVATNNLVNSISELLLLPCSTQNQTLDQARTNLSVVKTSVSTLFADISTKRSSLSLAKNTLAQAVKDLDLAKAGTDPYKIKAQMALVDQARAQVAQAESNLTKTMLRAPFSGVVSDVLIAQGETVVSGKTVISILANDIFEIEAKVPEIDIVKIKQGATVDVTLDAYGKSVIFPAMVTRINPTAVLEGGVPMYKVIIAFSEKDNRIKQGMTANVSIVTENKKGGLLLPARFVQVKNQEEGTVLVFDGEIKSVREVKLGLRGKNGEIEILSGLVLGDVVEAPITTIREAQKQTK